MKRVLITGASGFIGSYLTKHLKGFKITTLSLRDVNWQTIDVSGDVIIHCAGIAHSSHEISDSMYDQVNCEYTKVLLDKAIQANVQQFIFLSTALVYGEGHVGLIDANTPLNPQNTYARSKVCAEVALLAASSINTLILRLPLVLGDNAKGNLRSLSRLARWGFIFPQIKNKRSVLKLESLPQLIEELIEHQTNGILHPRSDQLSTTELYQQMRHAKTFIIPIPQAVIRFLRDRSRMFGKLFGDFYYKEGLL